MCIRDSVYAVPDLDLEALQPAFLQRRRIGQRLDAVQRGDAIELHALRLDVRNGLRGLVAQHVHLAAQQRRQRRRGAGIRNGRELRAQGLLQQHAAQLRHRAQAGVGQIYLVAVGARVLDELDHVARRQVLAAQQRHGHVGHLADVGEVGQRVERQLAVQRRRRGHAVVVDQEGIAVGRGARHVRGRQRAARAGTVLDHDALAQRLRHGGAQAARHHVGRTARRERHDQRDGMIGIAALGHGGTAGQAAQGQQRPGQAPPGARENRGHVSSLSVLSQPARQGMAGWRQCGAPAGKMCIRDRLSRKGKAFRSWRDRKALMRGVRA